MTTGVILPKLTAAQREEQHKALPTADWSQILEAAAGWLTGPNEVGGYCQVLDGKVQLATFAEGTARNLVTPGSAYRHGIIHFHTHPNGTPPSLMDLANCMCRARKGQAYECAVITKGLHGEPTALIFSAKSGRADTRELKIAIWKMLKRVQTAIISDGDMQKAMQADFDMRVVGDAQNATKSRQRIRRILLDLQKAEYLPPGRYEKSRQLQVVMSVAAVVFVVLKLCARPAPAK